MGGLPRPLAYDLPCLLSYRLLHNRLADDSEMASKALQPRGKLRSHQTTGNLLNGS